MKSLLNLLIKNHGTVSFFRGGSAIFLFSFLLSLTALAQAPTQTIRGQVLDADTREPLIGANVFLPETEPVLGTVSDLKGSFSIPNVEVGRYRLETSYLGYQSVFFPELLLKSGHELVLEVLMQKDTSLLLEAECVIYALRYVPLSEPIMSRQVITVEETQRFPATIDFEARDLEQ